MEKKGRNEEREEGEGSGGVRKRYGMVREGKGGKRKGRRGRRDRERGRGSVQLLVPPVVVTRFSFKRKKTWTFCYRP